MGRGTDVERELVNFLREEDYPAVKMPASGSSTKRELPDVLIKADGILVAAELKYTSGDYAYFDQEDIRGVKTFAKRWEAAPVAVSRYSHDTDFYVMPLYDDKYEAYLTGSDRLSMKRDDRGMFEELLRYLRILERST